MIPTQIPTALWKQERAGVLLHDGLSDEEAAARRKEAALRPLRRQSAGSLARWDDDRLLLLVEIAQRADNRTLHWLATAALPAFNGAMERALGETMERLHAQLPTDPSAVGCTQQ